MAIHRSQYKKEEKTFRLCSVELLDLYGIENCKIEFIEKFSCETKEENRIIQTIFELCK